MEVAPKFHGRETGEESCPTLWSFGREIMSVFADAHPGNGCGVK